MNDVPELDDEKQQDFEVFSQYPFSFVDFPWWPKDKAATLAHVFNSYIQFDGNLKEVIRQKVISRTQLWTHLKDERVRQVFKDIDRRMNLHAESVVVDIMQNGENEKNRLTAACYWLQANDPQKWDPGVRREKARVASELQGSILKQQITSETAKAIIAKDPFLQAPKESITMTDKSRYQSSEDDITEAAQQVVKNRGKTDAKGQD